MHLWQLYVQHEAKHALRALQLDRPPSLLELGGPRVLTADEERLLGGIIQEHARLLQLYQQHPRQQQHPTDLAASRASSTSGNSGSDARTKQHHKTKPVAPLTPEQVSQLMALSKQWRAMLPELASRAQELLVVYNLRLIRHMLQYLPYNSLPLEDLHAAGLTGLQNAAQRFDPGRARFSTVACMWVLQAMQREVARAGTTIRRPGSHYTILAHVQSVYGRDVAADLESRPDVVQQVSATFGLSPATIISAVQGASASRQPLSLESPAFNGANNPKSQGDTVPTYASMLTSADLDEGFDGEAGTADMAGQGSFLAAAGQVPAWVLAQRQQQPQEDATEESVASRAAAEQLQQWMAVLNQREHEFISLMYGEQLSSTLAAALQYNDASSGSSGASSSSSKASSVGSEAKRRLRLFPQGNMSLIAAVSQLGYNSTEALRHVRMSAFDKLRAVAAASEALARSPTLAAAPEAPAAAAAANPAAAASPTATLSSTEWAAAVAARVGARREKAAAAPNMSVHNRHRVALLQRFVSQHGRPPAPQEAFEGELLGRWLMYQCRLYQAGRLSSAITAAVEDVLQSGWDWRVPLPLDAPPAAARELLFRSYLFLVRGFLAAHGRLPLQGEDAWRGVMVGRWLQQQLMVRQRAELPLRHEQALEALPGWTWRSSSTPNSSSSSSSSSSSNASKDGDSSSSRRSSSNSSSSSSRRLSSARGAEFEQQLQRLQSYVLQHGRPPITSDSAPGSAAVYQWCAFVRSAHKRGALPAEHVAALETVPNWSWDKWQFVRCALQAFVLEAGRQPGRQDVHWGKWVGRWAERQRDARRHGRLTAEQVAALEAVPGWSWDEAVTRASSRQGQVHQL